jgi:hypothetical protein
MSIGAILGVAGSALGAMGKISAGRAEAERLSAEGNLLAINSIFSKTNAKLARIQGVENARLIRRESNFRIGSLSDRFTGSGIALSGTPLLSIQEATFEDEIAAQKAQFAGELEATGFINQANIQRLQAEQRAKQAKATTKSSLFSAAAGTLKTAGSLGGGAGGAGGTGGAA